MHREWKWSILESTIPHIDNVIDVGCGDLAFMEGRHVENYTGIDISETIIEHNKQDHPEWNFICSSADTFIPNLHGEVVFCHDILFHIIDDTMYNNILKNLTKYSDKYISIFTWDKNPISWYKIKPRIYNSKKYQKYRNFDQDLNVFIDNGFSLKLKESSKTNKYGAMYIFEKVNNEKE